MVTTKVRALIDGVRDNGKKYAEGDEFDMEISLVQPHVDAGQVEVVKENTGIPEGRNTEKQNR